jgi:hypothetical protein
MSKRLAKTPEAKAKQVKHLRPKPKKKNPTSTKRNLSLTKGQLAKLEAIASNPQAKEKVLQLLPPAYRTDLETGEPLETWQAIIRNYIETWPI